MQQLRGFYTRVYKYEKTLKSVDTMAFFEDVKSGINEGVIVEK